MLQWIIEAQREIYLALAEHIKAFAAGDSWSALAAFLPMGIVFGAVHAMTPDHSESLLAIFVMTFAIIRGVPEAGLAFAVMMMVGVALTLSAVALITVLFVVN